MLLENLNPDFFSLIRPIKKPRIWVHLSYTDILNQYRRTLLGPLWILLSLVIFSLAIGFVYSDLFSVSYFDHVIYMATGMIGWNWAAAILINSGMIYVTNANLILNYPTDKAYLIWSDAMSQFIVLIHQLPLVILFYLFGAIEPNWNILFLIPSVIIIFMINIGAAACMSIVVTRYRDLNKILSSLVIVIMITTPVFWSPEMVSGARTLMYKLNPFYYIVEIIRDPLLGKMPSTQEYLVASLLAVISLALGAIMHRRYSKYIVFRL